MPVALIVETAIVAAGLWLFVRGSALSRRKSILLTALGLVVSAFTVVGMRGTCDVKLARPLPPNEQAPHAQDEIYVVVGGRGVLVHDGRHDAFEAGDLLFVAAGVEHRFEDFSADFAIWRVFYGAHGGEAPRED